MKKNVGASCFAWLLWALASHATAQASYEVKIAPQPLGTALQELARQSGIQIIFFSNLTDGLTTRGLEGHFTLPDAIERLLADSGLTFRTLNAQAVEVRPMSRAERRSAGRAGSSNIPSQADTSDPMAEVVVRGQAEQLVALRVPTPLREIPQTMTIVSREEIRAQNARDLGEVMARVPGITTVRMNSLDPAFYSRGYKISTFHVDGGAAVNPRIDWAYSTDDPLASPDLSEYDHIEVLRGADALFGGLGNPGGTVSLVRKRPQRDFFLETSASAGSWDSQRVEMDVTGPLGGDGTLRGRGGVMYSHQQYFFDTAKRERKKTYGSMEFDIAPGGTITAGASLESDDSKPFIGGLMMYEDGTRPDFARSDTMMFDWAYNDIDMGQAYLQYRQDLGDWKLRLNAFGWKSETNYGYGLFSYYVDKATNVIPYVGEAVFSPHPTANRQKSFDVTLTGTLELFGLREEVAIGADLLHLDLELDNDRYWAVENPITLDDFLAHNVADPRIAQQPWISSQGHVTLDQYGLYASMRVHFNEAWSATGGARVNRDSVRLKSRDDGPVFGPGELALSSHESGVITPFAAVMYSINGHLTAYASHAEVFQNEDTFSVLSLNTVGTIKGATTEVGMKGAWRDGAINASLALYRITQKNVPINDLEDFSLTIPGTSRSRGVDLEMQGEPAPGWRAGGGYSWNTNEAADSSGPLSRATPRHLLKLWVDKRLSGERARWSFGGNLHAQSRITATDEELCLPILQLWGLCEKIVMSQPSYALLDLRAGYEIDANWRIAFNLNNVFDKIYDETLGHPFMHTWYGEPRNFTLRLDGRF